MTTLDFAKIKTLLRYDYETGKLFWLHRPSSMFCDEAHARSWNTKNAGKEALATTDSDGYLVGYILGQKYPAHRVIWLLTHGEWPDDQIDHINGDRSDNRLVNLRAVSNAENLKNQRRSSRNTSGATGVSWHSRDEKWEAKIEVDGKKLHLGSFPKFEAAVARRKAAEIEMGFHPNHGRAA